MFPSSSSFPDPWALTHFLQAGIISLNVTSSLPLPCDHRHADDGWHTFYPKSALGYLHNSQDDSLCRSLEYLHTNNYVRMTVLHPHQGGTLLVRVYIIPFDLSNVQGCLRVRKDTVTAKQHLRQALRYVMSGVTLWDGDLEGMYYARNFLPDETVCFVYLPPLCLFDLRP